MNSCFFVCVCVCFFTNSPDKPTPVYSLILSFLHFFRLCANLLSFRGVSIEKRQSVHRLFHEQRPPPGTTSHGRVHSHRCGPNPGTIFCELALPRARAISQAQYRRLTPTRHIRWLSPLVQSRTKSNSHTIYPPLPSVPSVCLLCRSLIARLDTKISTCTSVHPCLYRA